MQKQDLARDCPMTLNTPMAASTVFWSWLFLEDGRVIDDHIVFVYDAEFVGHDGNDLCQLDHIFYNTCSCRACEVM